eukprot:6082145-Ditylum_brightwellii.AAC.1
MPEQTKSNFQPGGTATLVTDKWTSYICNSGKDKLGRWTYTTLKGKSGQRVTIVSTYCDCDNNLAQAGSQICWKQQWCFLKKKVMQNLTQGKYSSKI